MTITHIDTACVLLDINGFRILTDPVLDKPGKTYHHGAGAFSRKTSTPALQWEELLPIDIVLLSHHQHKDNFDHKGKAFALTVPTIISTKAAAKAIPRVIGLDDWETYKVNTTKLNNLTVTATPAQHHPWWVPEFFSGKVIGFVITYDGQDQGVVYIAGDTVYFKGIDEVANRFKIDIGIFNMGAVQFRYLTGFGHYTMDGKDLLKSAKILNPNKVIPVHSSGWTHFKEKESTLKDFIAKDAGVAGKTIFLTPGQPTVV